MTFEHISLTRLTVPEALKLAKSFQLRAMDRGFVYGLQEAVDAVIDAHVEAAQG